MSNNEDEIKKELCKYITQNGYNPDICGFVWSVDWADPSGVENYMEDQDTSSLNESMSEDGYSKYQSKLFDKAVKYAVKKKDADDLNGEYYYFDCMSNIFGGRYENMVSTKAFKSDEEASDFGANFEATVKKYRFKDGYRVGRVEYIYEPHF